MKIHLLRTMLISLLVLLSSVGLRAQDNPAQPAWDLTETIQANHINMIGPTDIGFSIDYPSGWLARKRSAKLVINELEVDHQQALDYPFQTEGYSVLFAIERKSDYPDHNFSDQPSVLEAFDLFATTYGYQRPFDPTQTTLLSWPAIQVRTQDSAGNNIEAIHGLYGEHGQVILMSLIIAAPTAEKLEAFMPTWDEIVGSIQIKTGFINLDGYSVNLTCEGEGTPMVFLENNTDDNPNLWSAHIAVLQLFTTVCTRTRTRIGMAGLFTIEDYVDDLHLMLERSNIIGPYIMVGPLFGGYFSQVYASHYPEDLAGLVLVESFHPEHFERRDDLFRDMINLPEDDIAAFNQQEIDYIEEFGITFERSMEQVAAVDDLGNLPLFVVFPEEFAPQVSDVDRLWQFVWENMQIELATLSTNSNRIVIEGAYHSNILQQQEVAAAILTMVQQVRAGTIESN